MPSVTKCGLLKQQILVYVIYALVGDLCKTNLALLVTKDQQY